MSRELIALAKEHNAYFADRRGKYYLCPDGNARKLIIFTVESDYLTLEMAALKEDVPAMQYRWPLKDVETHWKRFSSLSQQQAQGDTKMAELPQGDLHNAGQSLNARPVDLTRIDLFNQALDPGGDLKKVTSGLMDAFDMVKTTPGFTNQARAMNEVGKSVIEVYKLRVEAMKLMVGMSRTES